MFRKNINRPEMRNCYAYQTKAGSPGFPVGAACHKKGGEKLVKKVLVFTYCFLLIFMLSASVFSTDGNFTDVPKNSAYYDSVLYLYENGITSGVGGSRYSPNKVITVQQWAAMLCRAYGVAVSDWRDCAGQAYRNGWMTATAVIAPETVLSYQSLLESGFAASGVPVYDNTLYGGKKLSHGENIMRVGRELGLCDKQVTPLSAVTRGGAAQILHALLTNDLTVVEPRHPVLIENRAGVNLNSYLLELNKIPASMVEQFNADGWKYVIDYNRTGQKSRISGMECTGLTSYAERTIYVSDANSVAHEFGHYYDGALGFPSKHKALYSAEGGSAPLRAYAKSDVMEYFADCFAYWIRYADNSVRMGEFQRLAPETYEYMKLIFDR